MIPRHYLTSTRTRRVTCSESSAYAAYGRSSDLKWILLASAGLAAGGILLKEPPFYSFGEGKCAIVKNRWTGGRRLEREPGRVYWRIPLLEDVKITKDIFAYDDMIKELIKAMALLEETYEYHRPVGDEEVFERVFESISEQMSEAGYPPEYVEFVATYYAALYSFDAGLEHELDKVSPYFHRHYDRFFGRANIPNISLFMGPFGYFDKSTNTVYVSAYYSEIGPLAGDPSVRVHIIHEINHAQGILHSETDTQITTSEILAEVAKQHDEYKPSLYLWWARIVWAALQYEHGPRTDTVIEKYQLMQLKEYMVEPYAQIKMALLDDGKVYIPSLKETWALNDLHDMLSDLYPTAVVRPELSQVHPEKEG